MNIDKPELLNFATQPVDRQGRLHQSFTIALGVDLTTGGALPIDQAFAAAMQSLAPGDCLDMGLPKMRAEWLLAGSACAPRGQTASGLTVDVRVGASRRRFLASSETPRAELPLTWAQTWGAEAENPEGLPAAQVRRAPLADAALPFGAPACPGPRGVWPCRMGRMGTYDDAWLKTRWPGVPDDFAWGFYNLAQPQQFLPEGLAGDEDIELAGLHPDHPRIACRLPGKTVRLFLTRATGESEAAIQLDTLWLFPNQLAGLLFWHGMAPCADESGSDILNARLTLTPEEPEPVAAAEEAAAPETPSFAVPDAAAALNAAGAAGAKLAGMAGAASAAAGVAAAAGTAAAATPSPPEAPEAEPTPPSSLHTPPSPASPPVDVKAELAAQLEESIPEINQGLAEAGLPPLTPEQIEETRQRLDAMAEQIQALQAQAAQPPPELPEVLRGAGVAEDRIQAVQQALDLDMPDPAAAADADAWGKAVDDYLKDFAALMQPSDEVLDTMRATLLIQGPGGDKVLEQMAGGPPPTPVEQLVQAGLKPEQAAGLVEALEADIPEGPDGLMQYAKQLEEAAGFPQGSVSDRIAAYQEVMDKIVAENPELAAAQAAAQGAPQGGADAAGAADAATETPAESAAETLGEAAGTVADATAEAGPPTDRLGLLALLARGGSLAGLCLAGFNLSGLDLSGLNLRGTDFKGANLKNATLDQAALAQGQLAGADLSGCSLAGADLAGADLTGAKADAAVFHQANLAGAKLSGMTAPDADFTGANLAGADLGGGAFAGADFSEAQAPGLKAAGADFSNARLRFCAMPEADFEEARFPGADIHQSVLDRAAFRRADLAEASFCYGTSVAGADFAGAGMAGGIWSQVRGAGANFTGIKARGASFADCELEACRWPGADLKESDFSRTRLAGGDMARANLFKASLREADLSHTDLAAANLYGADLCRSTIDATTNLAGADCANTILAARAAGGLG